VINRNSFITVLAALALGAPLSVEAQAGISEDFTGASTTNSWYFFNGACLTAGSAAGVEPIGGSAGLMPGCTSIKSSYYQPRTWWEAITAPFPTRRPGCAALHERPPGRLLPERRHRLDNAPSRPDRASRSPSRP